MGTVRRRMGTSRVARSIAAPRRPARAECRRRSAAPSRGTVRPVASLSPKRLIQDALARRGYEIRAIPPATPDVPERVAFVKAADEIQRRHRAQTREQVAALRAKYARPLYGLVNTWDLLEGLAACVDPTDALL